MRERFLLALAKFFGENPTPPAPLATIQICQNWFLEELLSGIFVGDDRVELTRERLNQLLLNCARPTASDTFFQYFFSNVRNIGDFEAAVDRFRVKAMWLFGNFRYAYKRLSSADQKAFGDLIRRTERISANEFTGRPRFEEIETIPEQDLGYLGYVSGQELKDRALTVEVSNSLLNGWDRREQIFGRFPPENREKVIANLAKRGLMVPESGAINVNRDDFETIIRTLETEVASEKSREKHAQDLGIRNTHRYLTMPYLDVYVATSMRTQQDYVEQRGFIAELFSNEAVRDLNLRYFDPTASYDPNRITKGLIECLMLRRARVTVYNAGAEDTMGKDSELAATLAQGKPVIVFVPEGERVVYTCAKCGAQKKVDYGKRAKTFHVDHPLGLQISARTGVAHGIIVVRTIPKCAEMLRRILLHDLDLSVKHEGGNFLLEEVSTKSIVRVASDDRLLTHSFWSYFRHTTPEPDI